VPGHAEADDGKGIDCRFLEKGGRFGLHRVCEGVKLEDGHWQNANPGGPGLPG